MTHRIAVWAYRNLLPATVVILLLADLGVGLNWLFSPPSSLKSVAYDTAKLIMPMDWYGLIVTLTTVAAGFVVGILHRVVLGGRIVGLALGGIWLFWAVVFALVPIGRHGTSYLGAIFALALCALHLLCGVAMTRPAAEGA